LHQTNKTVLWGAAIVIAALFVWGLEQVAVAPLESGEIYPPYSSLRADPLGTKALYESLAALNELQVSRLYKPHKQLAPGSTLLVLGLGPVVWDEISQKTLTEYENLVAKGGRLILAFVPVYAPKKKLDYPLLKDRWDVRFKYHDDDDVVEKGNEASGIPAESDLYFEFGKEWAVTESEGDDEPILIERQFGAGTIALLSQSYALSNEGLRESRDAAFISNLLYNNRNIVFDENHFGIQDTGSVTTLMRKYHLEPAIGVLLVTALLFLWRSASSLLPPTRSDLAEAVAGRDAQEGMVSLLERSVAEKDLLSTCYTEWARTAAGNRRANILQAEIQRRGGEPPVEIYRAASQILTQKNDRTIRPATSNH
jgi:hypothetical protein